MVHPRVTENQERNNYVYREQASRICGKEKVHNPICYTPIFYGVYFRSLAFTRWLVLLCLGQGAQWQRSCPVIIHEERFHLPASSLGFMIFPDNETPLPYFPPIHFLPPVMLSRTEHGLSQI